jgi:hypothetical protein
MVDGERPLVRAGSTALAPRGIPHASTTTPDALARLMEAAPECGLTFVPPAR